MLSTVKSWILRFLLALGYRVERVPPPPNLAWQRIRRLWATDDPIVRMAKAHLAAASSPVALPALGDRWGAYATRLRRRIAVVSSAEDLILLGQSDDAGVEKHFYAPELLTLCQAADMELEASLPSELYEAFASFRSPRIVRGDRAVTYRGRRLDFVTLQAAQAIFLLLQRLGRDRPRSVCDIGGGTGKYAYAWRTNQAHRPELVAIVDLPETLVYSEALLRSEFGDQVQYLDSPTTRPNSSGIVLCPIGNLGALADTPFDLVTNTGSMQEMTDAWVDFYMDWLDRQPCRYFWSSNYFASPLSNMQEGHNSWSPRPSARWRLIDSRADVGMRSNARLLFRRDEMERPSDMARRAPGR